MRLDLWVMSASLAPRVLRCESLGKTEKGLHLTNGLFNMHMGAEYLGSDHCPVELVLGE